MSYTPWTVIAGDTPSAAKWNELGANDASFADGSGFTWRNYRARAYLSGNQSIPDTTYTKIAFNAKTYDTNSNFDDVTNHRYVAPVDGYYAVSIHSQGLMCATYQRLIISLNVNGGGVAYDSRGTTENSDFGIGLSDIVFLNAGDYLEAFVYQDAGVPINISGNQADTWMSVHLLSVA